MECPRRIRRRGTQGWRARSSRGTFSVGAHPQLPSCPLLLQATTEYSTKVVGGGMGKERGLAFLFSFHCLFSFLFPPFSPGSAFRRLGMVGPRSQGLWPKRRKDGSGEGGHESLRLVQGGASETEKITLNS